jgi:adenine-specific DNA-methyltransferase
MSTPSSNTVSEPSASDAASSNDAASNGASSDADAPDVQPRPEAFEKLQDVLYEIFQFDVADLDFGIYRILNEKRKAVDRFIEDDLHAAVVDGLSTYAEGRQEDKREAAVEAAERVRQQVADDAIVGEGVGELNSEYENVQIKAAREAIADYREAKAAYEDAKVKAATENDIYNALARFFRRYYDDGDFITQRRFKSGDSTYVVPYDGEEVMLHWANRDQYYVKTSEHFKNYRFDAQDYDVAFHLVDAQLPQDDVKESDSRYFVLHGDDPVTVDTDAKTCVITMAYRAITEEEKEGIVDRYNEETGESKSRLKRRMLCTALEARILDAVEDARLTALLTEPKNDQAQYGRLYEHLNRYTAANTSDYFVHKDLKGFLTQQLDYFLKNEVLPLDDVLTGGDDADDRRRTFERAVDKAEVVRAVGQRIIDFLAQIEDFQKRLFEKKKFVVDTGYCVTLDRVPEELYDAILESDGQLDEWRALYALDETDDGLFGQGYQDGQFNRAFLETHPHAMIDTRHFDDQAFVDTLLAHLSDQDDDGIDGVVDGLCIQGENFQALNLLQERFRGEVQCMFADPPYNTGKDDFVYKDKYRHSSWMSMMYDRIRLSSHFLESTGSVWVTLDDNEASHLRVLVEQYISGLSFISDVAWEKVYSPRMDATQFSTSYDHVLSFACQQNWSPNSLTVEPNLDQFPHTDDDGRRYRSDPLRKWGKNSLRGDRPNLWFPIESPSGQKIWP